VLPAVEIYSEFQRLDPFGSIIPQDRAPRPREILSPAIPLNGFASFHVAVTVPPGQNYLLFVVPNPLNACRVEMYKEHFVRSGNAWIPDKLTQLHQLPDFGVMPDPEAQTAGQNTRVYLLDLWIPPNADLSGFRLEVQMKIGHWIVRPMEIRVIPAQVPDPPSTQKGSSVSLPDIDESADASAVAPLAGYVSGRTVVPDDGPLTVRAIIRRNAIQDMALAKSLDAQRTEPEPLKRFWDAVPRVSGAEWYLRVRDFIYSQSLVP
jgi:hypothetical protein